MLPLKHGQAHTSMNTFRVAKNDAIEDKRDRGPAGYVGAQYRYYRSVSRID